MATRRVCRKLWRAAPEGAHGQRDDEPISELIAEVDGEPVDVDGSFHAQVTSIEQTDDTASVTLSEEGLWGTVSFVDFFSLARIDGTWKIVNKTYVHAPGDPLGGTRGVAAVENGAVA
ncbi:MAG TPA: nuclear transport factor 2 family protein [Baekduia sp.]